MQQPKRRAILALSSMMALVAGLGFAPRAAQAQVKPGDLITADSAPRVKDLVSPGVYYKVSHGMELKITPTERVDWPPPYKDATEKYSAQVSSRKTSAGILESVMSRASPFHWSTLMTPMWRPR